MSSLNTYGGIRENYAPILNPSTDYDANQIDEANADVAACTRTVSRGRIKLTLASTTPGLILNDWETVWKESTDTLPILARSSTGVFTITFPTSVVDVLGVVRSVNIRFSSVGNVEGATGLAFTSPSVNVITLRTKLFNGTADDLAGSVVSFDFC
jgi:hypothetical protein